MKLNATSNQRPLRTLVLGTSESSDLQFVTPLRDTGCFQIMHRTDHCPDASEIPRMVALYAPDIVMLNFRDVQKALDVADMLHLLEPGLPLVAYGESFRSDELIRMIRSGVREVVTLPMLGEDADDLAMKCTKIVSCLSRPQSDEGIVLSFLPSKPGVGTSTVAAHVALATADAPDATTLLIDFDLQAGLLAHMLKLDSAHSLADVIQRADDLDEIIWGRIVQRRGELDVLASGRLGFGANLTASNVQLVLDFAKRHYKVTCADLSGALEPFSLDILKASQKIFLVTTPEIPALHLARERYEMLRNLGLADQTALILNRWQKGSLITVREIEQTVRAPIFATLPNDYRAVHKALLEGKPLGGGAPLAREIRLVSRKILGQNSGDESQPAKTSRHSRLRRLLGFEHKWRWPLNPEVDSTILGEKP